MKLVVGFATLRSFWWLCLAPELVRPCCFTKDMFLFALCCSGSARFFSALLQTGYLDPELVRLRCLTLELRAFAMSCSGTDLFALPRSGASSRFLSCSGAGLFVLYRFRAVFFSLSPQMFCC